MFSINYRNIGILLIGGMVLGHSLMSCSWQNDGTAKIEQRTYTYPGAYGSEFFNKLPAEQRKAIRDLFLNEFYQLSVTPIPANYGLDDHNIAIWRKAKQQRLLPDNDTEDWTGFFIFYNFGMWIDIFETLKSNPKYLSGKGIVALCHYVTVLQFCDDGKPTESYFNDKRLQELRIYKHPSRYSVHGVYSVR